MLICDTKLKRFNNHVRSYNLVTKYVLNLKIVDGVTDSEFSINEKTVTKAVPAKNVSIMKSYLNIVGAALTIVLDSDQALRIEFDNIILDMAP